VVATVPLDARAAFLARANVARLAQLKASLGTMAVAPASTGEAIMPTPDTNARRTIVGDDPAIRGLLLAIRKVAASESTVLVQGESGTGKELVAEAIHAASNRARGPLVVVNCAALVETLLLSELFGHEKGAFTGAVARRRGRFECAAGGTLFLDEIGDISPRTQTALLRVLQERTFERVGSTLPLRADVRIVCATHRDLRAMVERGDFREDLYYRLRGICLVVPPLRERLGDLPGIAQHLLERIAAERSERAKTLGSDALALLQRHRWPGNVRELENVLRVSSLFADSEIITAPDLVENVGELRDIAQASSSAALPSWDDHTGGEESVTHLPLLSADAYAHLRGTGASLREVQRRIERDCIARALAEAGGNITHAAALLGMKRPRLSQLVKHYGLAAVSEAS
jgi:sigma-54 specific flagellar transcriptional regulator A